MNRMNLKLGNSWKSFFEGESKKEYFMDLMLFLEKEQKLYTVFPPQELVFSCFEKTPFERVKVVLLGQDPYHGVGQADGMSFSVPKGVRFPPSLRNIFKELKSDLDIDFPENGDLSSWAAQGVLLLNATLTVRESQATAHQKKGWEVFTDEVIRELSRKREYLVFVLWGKSALKKGEIIDASKHLILTAPHPSPLSSYRGFFGSKPFSKINQFLEEKGLDPIDWRL